jgi:DNA-binding transcriptional ArsR family regulator
MATAGSQLAPEVVKAMAHPLRFRILVALEERVASPKQIADDLGEPLGRVGHHVRMLARLGAVELVGTRPRRGATEHFYRAVVRPLFDDAVWAALPRATRRALFGPTVRRIVEDTVDAAERNGFDHPLAHVSYMLLELDPAARVQVAAALEAAVREVLEIQRRARDRDCELEQTEVAIMHFDRAPVS